MDQHLREETPCIQILYYLHDHITQTTCIKQQINISPSGQEINNKRDNNHTKTHISHPYVLLLGEKPNR